jgi:integrase
MLGTYNVNVLTAPMLRTYAQHRMFPVPGLDGVITTGIGKETLRKEFVTLTRALALAKERGLFTLDLDIVPKVRVKYVPRQRTISEESFRKLLGQLPAKRLPWVALAIFAGGKASEIEDVQWTDLDFPRARIALPGRTLPLAEPLRKLLEPLRRDPDTGKLLEGRVVEPWTNQRRDLAEAARSVGIPALSPNDLRKTFAVWLREGGEDSRTVAGMMGHSSTRMIDLVGQELRAAGFRSAVAKLPKRAL